MAVEAEYAFTDRFSMSLGIPYVFAKYKGPHAPRFRTRPRSTRAAVGTADFRISA
jgi:hypothetical protein